VNVLLAPCLVVFLGYLTLGMALPVIPFRVHDELGLGAVAVGFAIGIQSLATLVTRPFTGVLVDERGPRFTILLGGVLGILVGLAYLGSSALAAVGASYTELLVGRVLLGLSESMVITGSLAWGIARVGPTRSGAVMVWVGIAMFAALSAGAPLGAELARTHGFGAVAIAVTLVPLLMLACAATLQPVRRPHGPSVSLGTVLRAVAPAGVGLALTSIGYGAIVAFVTLFFAAHGWHDASYAYTVFGAAFIVARLLCGSFPDRFGGVPVAIGALLVELVGQLLLWRAGVPGVALVGAALTGAGYSLAFPAFGVEAVRRIAAANRGAALGVYVAFLDLGLGVMGPLNGLVAAQFGYPAVYAAGASSALLALGVAFALRTVRAAPPRPPQ
jgi:predicted MFS family arabinose efflux permease